MFFEFILLLRFFLALAKSSEKQDLFFLSMYNYNQSI